MASPAMLLGVPKEGRQGVKIMADRDLTHLMNGAAPGLIVLDPADSDRRDRCRAEKLQQTGETGFQPRRRCRMRSILAFGPFQEHLCGGVEWLDLNLEFVLFALQDEPSCVSLDAGRARPVAFGGGQVR